MKKITQTTILLVCSLFIARSTQAQTPAYKGIFIDKFDAIVGNTLEEDSLLHYLKDSSFNSIICYGISSALSSTASNIKNTYMANFIKKARTQYGIKNVMASSESYTTFLNLVVPYNRSRTDTLERFNYYYLEFEFWNPHSTSPASASNNGYYCSTYLTPRGYTCDTAGAFKYYRKMITSLDSIAAINNVKSATYVGTINAGQSKFIGQTLDFVLIDNYTSSISNIYTNIKTRMSYFGTGSKTVQIVPIFASYSPGGNFLGDWLMKAPVGPHTEKGVYYTYFLPRYTAETGSWKSKVNVQGYQWYRYSGMPHNGNYSTGSYCTAPTGLSISSITTTSVLLAWAAVSGSLGYNVQYRKSGTSTWSSAIATSATSLAVSSLTSSTVYEFQVMSSCVSSTSAYSTSVSITTLAPPCSTPSGLTSSLVTASSATLSWTAVSGVASYAIQYRGIGTTAWTSATNTTNSKTITGLNALTDYEFHVQSVCSSSNASVFSASASFTTLAPQCSIPSGLTSSLITENSVTIGCTAVSGVASYAIQYRALGTSTWTSSTSTTNSKNITGLIAATVYEFQVQSICSSTTKSVFSTSTNFTTLAASSCGVPLGIYATAATTTSFTIQWAAITGATTYKVQYRKIGGTTWTSVTTNNTFKNISSLSVATSYEYQVQSICAVGISSFSPIASVSTLSDTSSCGVPIGLYSSYVQLTTVTLNWVSVSGASSYKVQYRKVGTTSWSSKTTSFTNKAITGLTANTTYEFEVQTVCSVGSSAYSAIATFVTTPSSTARIISVSSDSSTNAENKSVVNQLMAKDEITIFPNPNTGENITVKLKGTPLSEQEITLLSVTGAVLFSKKIFSDNEGNASITIVPEQHLANGIYLVSARHNKTNVTCKLVVR